MTNINSEIIGALIKQLLELKNMSVGDLAELIEVSNVSVGEWLKGKRPSVVNICKIADIFNVSVDEIVNGKLVEEGTEDYLDRNFNLDRFDLDEIIDSKNMDSLCEYLRMCILIKNHYIILLDKWSHELINKDEFEEFLYQSKYIEINTPIFGDKYEFNFREIIENKEDVCKKTCVREYFDKFSNLKEVDYNAWIWEIEKLLNYKFNIYGKNIIKIADQNVLRLFFDLASQQYKDEMLQFNLSDTTKEDLSGNESFGTILSCGANYLYRNRGNKMYLDDEIFDLLEGKKTEDLERINAGNSVQRYSYNCAGITQLFNSKEELKTISYYEYQKTINNKRTMYLRDLCNLKYKSPLMYYKNLVEGNYDDYF